MAANTSTKNKEREFIKECILLYQDLPALWDVKSKQYHDRDKKNKAYDLLLTKYKEMFPEATKDDVRKKFNALRTNYRKELKKYVDSKKGASTEFSYEPNLWYFKEMSFLYDQQLSEVDSSLDTTHHSSIDDEERIENLVRFCHGKEDSTLDEFPKSKPNKKPRTQEYTKHINLSEDLSEEKDEFYYWGMAYAADLRKMKKTQQFYAKKAIAEIMMEGRLGLLDRHSVKINETHSIPSLLQYSPPSSNTSISSPTYIGPERSPEDSVQHLYLPYKKIKLGHYGDIAIKHE